MHQCVCVIQTRNLSQAYQRVAEGKNRTANAQMYLCGVYEEYSVRIPWKEILQQASFIDMYCFGLFQLC